MPSRTQTTEQASSLTADEISICVESSGRDIYLIDDVTLSLVPGELVALIGPNGSGKSTIIRALSRVFKPKLGKICLDNRDLYSDVDSRTAARRIGVVPQDTQIAFDFTVREVVAMGRAPHRSRFNLTGGDSDHDRKVVDDCLRKAGISLVVAERPLTSLSGGERQRVIIARALAQEAPILLLDEPTASLDIRHEGRLLSWLRSLAVDEKRTVVVVLHDLNVAAQYADRVVLIDRGKVAAQGTPAETLTSDRIRDVYGTAVWVRAHPVTGRPLLLTLPSPFDDFGEAEIFHGARIHLLGGGGSAAPLMMQLAGGGARLTVGALNLNDTDQEAAAILGIAHAVAPPFSSLTVDSVEKGIALGLDADVIVLCETPFGDGNIATLDAARRLATAGIPTVLVSNGSTLSSGRDFTVDNTATRRWADLSQQVGVFVTENPLSQIESILADPNLSERHVNSAPTARRNA